MNQAELKQEYDEYIRSYQWMKKRNAALQRAGEKCERCGFSKWSKKLEVHHLTYTNFKNEQPEDLVVLCKECHEKADAERRQQTQIKQKQMKIKRAQDLYNARLDGWARKKYGDDWEIYHDSVYVNEEFDQWLNSRNW